MASRLCICEWKLPQSKNGSIQFGGIANRHCTDSLDCYSGFDRNAHAIALFLEAHKGVSKVVYPGLQSHPQHDIAKKQQYGFGAMITFYCVGKREQSAVLLKKVSGNERLRSES